jgi:N-methylhydantoinase B/oxoprolinase/acetone carboxylase alpha subunit
MFSRVKIEAEMLTHYSEHFASEMIYKISREWKRSIIAPIQRVRDGHMSFEETNENGAILSKKTLAFLYRCSETREETDRTNKTGGDWYG